MSEVVDLTPKTHYYSIKGAEKLTEKLRNDFVNLAWRIRTLRMLCQENEQLWSDTLEIEQLHRLNRLLITMVTQTESIAIGVTSLEKLTAIPASTAENPSRLRKPSARRRRKTTKNAKKLGN